MKLAAHIIGISAFIIFISSIQTKKKSNLLIVQLVANLLYGIQYLLLNAFGTALMNLISAIRCLVFQKYDKKTKNIPLWILLVFILIVLLIGYITIKSPIGIIPIFITIIYIYSTWQKNMIVLRISFVLAACLWIIFNFSIGAYASLLGNVFEIVSGLIAIIRFKEKPTT